MREVCLLFFVCVASLAADTDPRWNHPLDNPAPPESMAFTTDRYRTAMSDSAFCMAMFDDGSVMMFSLFHYETRLFERWGIYLLLSQVDGETIWVSESIDEDSIEFASDRLHITAGENVLSGEGMRYRLDWSAGDLTIALQFENLLPPWMLGDGLDVLGDPRRSFQRRAVFSPWAKVRGTVAIARDGVSIEREVVGEGMGEKSIIVNGLNRFNPELISMRVFGFSHEGSDVELAEGLHIGLLDSTAHPAYDSIRLPRLFVARDGAWLFSSGSYEIDFLEMDRVEGLPYEYPVRFSLVAHGSEYELTGEYSVDRLFNTTDILAELPGLLRRLVLLFVDRPVYYRTTGTFVGTLTHPDGHEESIRLYGPYEYVVAL